MCTAGRRLGAERIDAALAPSSFSATLMSWDLKGGVRKYLSFIEMRSTQMAIFYLKVLQAPPGLPGRAAMPSGAPNDESRWKVTVPAVVAGACGRSERSSAAAGAPASRWSSAWEERIEEEEEEVVVFLQDPFARPRWWRLLCESAVTGCRWRMSRSQTQHAVVAPQALFDLVTRALVEGFAEGPVPPRRMPALEEVG